MKATTSRRFNSATIKLAIALIFTTAILNSSDWLWRWDQLAYDAQLRLWPRPVPQDVIIVAIDEGSLTKIGRWPWTREKHAQLIHHLTNDGARVIGMDIIFAEQDKNNPSTDAALEIALTQSKKVVLPVLIEQPRQGGQLFETLPIPRLSEQAAGLGHVHIELDPDGMARSLYLKEGLGTSFWPHFAVSILEVAGIPVPQPLPGKRRPPDLPFSPYLLVRDHHVLFPFLGPPGHFQSISYANVLNGTFNPGTFTNKIVLVGVTATGLGDSLPTPMSGFGHSMAGVEIIANILTALRDEKLISSMETIDRIIFSIIIVLFPVFLFPRLKPRYALPAAVILIFLTLFFSLMLLRISSLWFPPVASMATLILSYPLWSWQKLEFTMNYLNHELNRLNEEPGLPTITKEKTSESTKKFISQITDIAGWRIVDSSGDNYASYGHVPDQAPSTNPVGVWLNGTDKQSYWMNILFNNECWQLGIRQFTGKTPDASKTAILVDLVSQVVEVVPQPRHTTSEIVESRIEDVRQATERIGILRKFISDILEQMADGVLVVSSLGHIRMHNQQALHYLGTSPGMGITGDTITTALINLIPSEKTNWMSHISHVLLQNESIQIQAQNREDRELLIQLVPLTSSISKHTTGLIVNITDISQLKESERRRSEMLSFLSHDLRSPLVSLLAHIQMNRANTNGTDFETLLDTVQQYGEKTLGLAEDFVHLARAESGEGIKLRDMDFCSTVYNALDQVWAQAQRKNIQLSSRFSEPQLWITGDPNLLERAVVNLLTNAIKYCPEGSVVSLKTSVSEGQVSCCIQDNGPGIPESELPRLFERFYRSNTSEDPRKSGTGLGLAFVKIVMDNHGGKVYVSSILGSGCTFCLKLPIPGNATLE